MSENEFLENVLMERTGEIKYGVPVYKDVRHIVVTQEHIDTGSAGDPWSCPIALALMHSGFQAVYVGGQSAQFWDNRIQWDGKLPRVAEKFIEHFDAGDDFPFEPFEFDLEMVGL